MSKVWYAIGLLILSAGIVMLCAFGITDEKMAAITIWCVAYGALMAASERATH